MARRCSAERAAKAIGGFATAKKNIVIQFQGRERQEQNLLDQIKLDILKQGMNDEDIEELDVYVKPEEQLVYYVVNKELSGQISF